MPGFCCRCCRRCSAFDTAPAEVEPSVGKQALGNVAVAAFLFRSDTFSLRGTAWHGAWGGEKQSLASVPGAQSSGHGRFPLVRGRQVVSRICSSRVLVCLRELQLPQHCGQLYIPKGGRRVRWRRISPIRTLYRSLRPTEGDSTRGAARGNDPMPADDRLSRRLGRDPVIG